MPYVSVIVPNYNHERFLKERLDSIFGQKFDDFEVIILDDCSNDNSRGIIESYRSNSKLSNIVYNDINSGTTFKQWHKGINLAKGELIWIAESDDYCAPEFLSVAIKALSQLQTSLFFSSSYQVDENSNVIGDYLWWTSELTKYDWTRDFTVSGNEFIEDCLVHKNVIVNASAVVFRRRDIPNIFLEIQNLRKCGDWLFWSSLILNRQISYHGRPLNYFRNHEKTTRNFETKEGVLVMKIEEAYVKSKIYNAIGQKKKSKQVFQGLFNYVIKLTSLSEYRLLNKVWKRVMGRKFMFPVFFIYKAFFKTKLVLKYWNE